MKNKDYRVLAALRNNSRIHFSRISRSTKIPLSSVCEIYQKLTMIRRNSAMIIYERTGFPIRIFVAVCSKNNQRENLRKFLELNMNVNTASQINGEYDFFIDLVFKNMQSAQNFIEELETFTRKRKLFYVINVLKIEDMFTKEAHSSMLKL